jgi:hypothetical protein
MDDHIFVGMEHAVDQYNNVHMFQHIYVYKQVLYYKVLDKEIVLILTGMKQYSMEHWQHDHMEDVSELVVDNH